MVKDDLLEHAKKAKEMSYSPYSKVRTGAAILMKDGKYIYGTTIENSYAKDSMCAERIAIYNAYIAGYDLKKDVVGIAVAKGDFSSKTPCSSCRRVMNELLDKKIPVYIVDASGKESVETVGSLSLDK